jgi:thiamine-phosphate pyrophosphorylase
MPFIVNDRPDVALALDADGVHLGQNDLPLTVARRILGERIIGRSTHATEELDAELGAPERADYLVAGPVWPTPTKQGRPGTGLELIRHAAATSDLPWFAIGGINPDNLVEVMGAGARRVVVVRAIAEAPDPVAAAARLRAALDEAPA